MAGREVTLGYAPREIVCRTHGRTEEEIPWAARHARVSYRFEYAVLRLCKVRPKLLQMPASTLSDQLHRSIERYRSGHRVRGLRVIGIDEISYRKRHKYATLVYDSARSSCGSDRAAAGPPSTSFSTISSVTTKSHRSTPDAAT